MLAIFTFHIQTNGYSHIRTKCHYTYCTWTDTEDIFGSLDEHLPHGDGAEDFAAKQTLSEVKTAAVGTGRMQHQHGQWLNFHAQIEEVWKHHYTALKESQANHEVAPCPLELLALTRILWPGKGKFTYNQLVKCNA